jgi:pullulanase/glycogen debranching enzyme
MIDWETMNAVRDTAQSINPDTVLIAEPWGPHYDPNGYSDREIGAWNDKIRNGVKGSHPIDDPGFLTGNWQYETSREVLENLILGTLEHHPNGLFNDSGHSVNYLESHDGYTLGDFIRIFRNPDLDGRKVQDRMNHLRFSSEGLRMAKLGALFLFVSQGIVMIHQGQEWGRSKVIAETDAEDYHVGQIDHDSYNKDNDTNHLNYEELEINRELVSYYQGLIALRKQSPALRNSGEENIYFQDYEDPLHLSFFIDGSQTDDDFDYFVALNGNAENSNTGKLPDGDWQIMVNGNEAGLSPIEETSGTYKLEPSQGMVFRQKNS